MAKIINPSNRDITLLTRHVIPARGSLDTTNEVLRCTDNVPMLNGLVLSGQVSVEFDAEAEPDAPAEPVSEASMQADVETQLSIAAAESAPKKK